MVKYTEKQLVEFGNYLLSQERKDRIVQSDAVHHADIANWKSSQPESDGSLTDGQKLMGVTFNPSKDPRVDDVKNAFASIADLVFEQGTPDNSYNFNLIRGCSLHALIHGQMDVVKLLTFKY